MLTKIFLQCFITHTLKVTCKKTKQKQKQRSKSKENRTKIKEKRKENKIKQNKTIISKEWSQIF